jgi:hypothetical protein
MIDAFDIFAFVVFAVLGLATVIIVVTLGSLPGQIAQKRGHPQAAAVNVASWLGIATLGILWPLALIWAFLTPRAAVTPPATEKQDAPPASGLEAKRQLEQMQARVTSLEAAMREIQHTKGATS